MTPRLTALTLVSAALHGVAFGTPFLLRGEHPRPLFVELAPAPSKPLQTVAASASPRPRPPGMAAVQPGVLGLPDLPPAVDRLLPSAAGPGQIDLPERGGLPAGQPRPAVAARGPEPPATTAIARTPLRFAPGMPVPPPLPSRAPLRIPLAEAGEPPVRRASATSPAATARPDLPLASIPVAGRLWSDGRAGAELPSALGSAEPPGSRPSLGRLLASNGAAESAAAEGTGSGRSAAASGTALSTVGSGHTGGRGDRGGSQSPGASEGASSGAGPGRRPERTHVVTSAAPVGTGAGAAGAPPASSAARPPSATRAPGGSAEAGGRGATTAMVLAAGKLASAAPPGPARDGETSRAGAGSLARAVAAGQGRDDGTGATGPGEASAEYSPYLQRLRHQIQQTITYPATARRRGLSGTVRIELVLEPTGEVARMSVVAPSSHSVLDNAVLEALRSLRPIPFPPDLPRQPIRVELPIVFDFR